MSASFDLSRLFVRQYERNDNKLLQFHQCEVGDVGCVVWDAALVLSKYLETADFSNGQALISKVIVELGAGTGAVGLVAASFGARVTITDLPEFIPLLKYNIQANQSSLGENIQAQPLIWGIQPAKDIPREPDYILLADCIYYEESLEPLVSTISLLCGKQTEVLCCYEKRNSGNKPELEKRFFELIHSSFDVEEIPQERQDQHFCSDDIHIFKFKWKECLEVLDLKSTTKQLGHFTH